MTRIRPPAKRLVWSFIHDYNSPMASVSISEVKARLSHYISIVRRGGEVQILDRGVPVARLVGLRGQVREETDEAALQRLEGEGILRPASTDVEWILQEEPLDMDADLSSALAQEREEGP